MKRLTYYLCGILLLLVGIMPLSAQSQYKDTLVVARDGSGDYRTLTEAMEGIRAFMDYKVTVLIKNGTYKEKAIIPSWVQNKQRISALPFVEEPMVRRGLELRRSRQNKNCSVLLVPLFIVMEATNSTKNILNKLTVLVILFFFKLNIYENSMHYFAVSQIRIFQPSFFR